MTQTRNDNDRDHGTYGHEISKERGQEARDLRTSNNLSRDELASLLNRSTRTLVRWELDGITEENFKLVEEAVGATIDARRDGSSGVGRLRKESIRAAPSLELALELTTRIREVEKRNRALDILKSNLEEAGLRQYIPNEM